MDAAAYRNVSAARNAPVPSHFKVSRAAEAFSMRAHVGFYLVCRCLPLVTASSYVGAYLGPDWSWRQVDSVCPAHAHHGGERLTHRMTHDPSLEDG